MTVDVSFPYGWSNTELPAIPDHDPGYRTDFLDCANRQKRSLTVHRDIALAILADHAGAVRIIDSIP